MTNNKINWAFFGGSDLSVIFLEKLKEFGLVPSVIITTPDMPKGRNLVLTPPEAKVWAEENNILCLQFQSLRRPEVEEEIRKSINSEFDVFVVASYGKIIPENILNIPTHKTLNLHPSLLPKLRGPSPIISSILEENETGVSIILLDNEMDHGPILAQKKISVPEWPPYEKDLQDTLALRGAEMFFDILPKWLNGEIKAVEQDHKNATFCSKIEKKDGQIDLADNPETNLRKIRAFHRWPGAFYFENGKRIIIREASIKDGKLQIEKVVPEGKKEMNYSDYLRGIRN